MTPYLLGHHDECNDDGNADDLDLIALFHEGDDVSDDFQYGNGGVYNAFHDEGNRDHLIILSASTMLMAMMVTIMTILGPTIVMVMVSMMGMRTMTIS